jgi:hypothetical protein
MRESVKMVSAALDDAEDNQIVLRGVISPESIAHLKVGPYQREILPVSKINDLVTAFNEGSVPDIDLGMRGGDYMEKDGAFYLQNDVYIIDGLQRTTAARQVIKANKTPKLGAIVHFNTTEEWERNRFRVLNTTNTKLSPSVLIRNMQKEYLVVDLLLSLVKDKTFILYDKVCWNQRMVRQELITGLTLLKSSAFLHSRFGSTRGQRIGELIPALQKVYDKLGRSILRENIKAFWDLLDECWQVRYITFKEGSVCLKSGFLLMMATIFSEHSNFWRDSKLFIEKDLRRKISLFPINDPEIIKLAGQGGGVSSDILYQLMIRHINSGKRTKRLIPSKKSLKKSVAEVEEVSA